MDIDGDDADRILDPVVVALRYGDGLHAVDFQTTRVYLQVRALGDGPADVRAATAWIELEWDPGALRPVLLPLE